MSTFYYVGSNVPGFLPESDPIEFRSWEDAAFALDDALALHVEHLEEAVTIDPAVAIVLEDAHTNLRAAREMLEHEDIGGLSVLMPSGTNPKHDLGLVFWVEPVLIQEA